MIAGDFNGHHPMWESGSHTNKTGRSLYEALLNNQTLFLIAPSNLGTRIDPSTGKMSTIDLTITSPDIAIAASIKDGP